MIAPEPKYGCPACGGTDHEITMRPTYRVRLALACALGLTAPCSFAQSVSDEDELSLVYGDRPTISLVTGSRQPLRHAPAAATVITAEDIENMGATDLDQVLEAVPGVHVTRSSMAYTPLYVVRGIFSQFLPQTLMLQNGSPTTTMFIGNKGNAWGGLPVTNIARIEIIRGPGSALYGADAYSGVINLITKDAEDMPGTRAGVQLGSFKTGNAWFQHGGRVGPVKVAAYLQVGHTDGPRKTVRADAQTQNDNAFGTQASLAPASMNVGYEATDANLDLSHRTWRLHAGYKLRNEVGTGIGVASALDPIGTGKSERITADLSWNDPQFGRHWGAGVALGYLAYNDTTPHGFVLFPAGASFPTGDFPNGMIGAPEKWERQWRLSAFATYSGFARHQWRLGWGHDDLHLYRTRERKNFTVSANGLPVPTGEVVDYSDSAPFMRPQRRKVDYVYLQDEWNFAHDWALTAGVRHDRYSDVGSTTNPRLALVWDVSLDLTAKLLYGEAFRAPSFTELASINNPVVRGNPELRPETIRTWEAGLSWRARPDLLAQLSVFHYLMKDIIRAVPGDTPGSGSVQRNQGRQRGAGMELEFAWAATRGLNLLGNYAYQKSIDLSTREDAGYAPHHHLYVRGEWELAPGWMFGPQLNWVADRRRPADDRRAKVPDYTSVDLALRHRADESGWRVFASVRNLFNANAREPSLAPGHALPDDLPLAGRAFSVQLVHAF